MTKKTTLIVLVFRQYKNMYLYSVKFSVIRMTHVNLRDQAMDMIGEIEDRGKNISPELYKYFNQ